MKRRAFSPLCPRQKGVAAIEMAIVLPLLVLIFTGMIEYGRLMWHYDALAKATRDAARFLAEEPKPITTALATAQTMVVNAASAAGVKDIVSGNVIPTCTPDCTNPAKVTVSVNYPFIIGGWVPIISAQGTTSFTTSLTPHTTMRYMR
jgi:Flp pilus assembly protein TadG